MKDVTTLPQTIIYFQTLWTSQNDVTRWKKENTRPQCKLKLSISCIKDVNITPQNYKTLRRKHRQNTVWHNHSKILYDQPLRIMEIKTEINKWDLIKLKALAQKKKLSVQFSCLVITNSLWPHGLQHARLPCPSSTPWACSNSCQLSWWCHSTISSSTVPFSSCLQSFPASGSFPMSQFFASGGQNIGASASALVLHCIFRTDFL